MRGILQTVKIKVKMDCDGCERRVRNAVSSMKGSSRFFFDYITTIIFLTFFSSSFDYAYIYIYMSGVRSVEVNRKQSLVVVSGYVEPKEVLKEVKSTGKTRAELWPYVAHDLVAYPYVAGAYDKRAPSGFVKNVPQARADPTAPGEVLANFFNEEDPNACSIM